MSESKTFKIDRSQRMHSDGVVVRVYEVFGAESFGWDTNRETAPAPERPVYQTRSEAEAAADESVRRAGHHCSEGCYRWRSLS